ncbi:MAG: ATP-dependent DNA helicase PcrA, partial [Clostridia bacterium]|nr:ATP-dependent DNA helicase PcrA [Clostridia bacterium]MBP5460439.1 ATP-dependent DNA helicase PcrA [Clostridia bacterium]
AFGDRSFGKREYSSKYSADYGSGYSSFGRSASDYSGWKETHKSSAAENAKKARKAKAAAAAGSGETFAVGDTVRHKAFGTGVVLNAKPMGNDTLLEIAFEKAGTKKVMANFAKLTKV